MLDEKRLMNGKRNIYFENIKLKFDDIRNFSRCYKKYLKKRDNIFISGFGTFSIVKRKARKGRNPKTREVVKVSAKIIPKFKPAKVFKEAVK